MAETLSPVLPSEIETAARRVLERADGAKLSPTITESCTGGMFASPLTDVDGVSSVFERGFVTYGEAAKCELPGIPTALIDRHGAAGREMAVTMASGAIPRSHADIALSITGFAGPAGSGDAPGPVHFACARTRRTIAHREMHCGDIGRGPPRIECLRVALARIEEAL